MATALLVYTSSCLLFAAIHVKFLVSAVDRAIDDKDILGATELHTTVIDTTVAGHSATPLRLDKYAVGKVQFFRCPLKRD